MGEMYLKTASSISHTEKNAVFNHSTPWLLIGVTIR